jgi:hypothetical protein
MYRWQSGGAGTFIRIIGDSEEDSFTLDLANEALSPVKIKIGNGFAIGAHGGSYPFILLFRLVDCNWPSIEIDLRIVEEVLNCAATLRVRSKPLFGLCPPLAAIRNR